MGGNHHGRISILLKLSDNLPLGQQISGFGLMTDRILLRVVELYTPRHGLSQMDSGLNPLGGALGPPLDFGAFFNLEKTFFLTPAILAVWKLSHWVLHMFLGGHGVMPWKNKILKIRKKFLIKFFKICFLRLFNKKFGPTIFFKIFNYFLKIQVQTNILRGVSFCTNEIFT